MFIIVKSMKIFNNPPVLASFRLYKEKNLKLCKALVKAIMACQSKSETFSAIT